MDTSAGTAEAIEDTDLFPVWDFLAQDKQNAPLSNPIQSSFDHMDLETFPDSRENDFSPIFHELVDHDQFFTDHAVNNGKSLVAGQEPNLDYFTPEGPVGEIHDILLHSAGLSALQPTFDMFGIEAPAPDRPNPKAGSWTPLPSTLELQLVQIYFQTMHTLCPVLEELFFYQWYHGRDRKKKNIPLRDLIFHVVIFSAFAHIDLDQLEKSPYSSVPDGQKALFNHVHELYNSLRDANQGAAELVQCSCILSHWSPYDSSREVNYFWADEALRHALLGGMNHSNRPHDRVVWWCCLQRNRCLTLALRRPHKLKQYQPGRLPTIADFGTLWAPNADVEHSRIYAANLTISLCKLSVQMNEIVLLRHSSSRWDDWRDRSDAQDSTGLILDRIVAIDRSLNAWAAEFEHTIREFDETKIHRRTCVSAHVLRMMAYGTKAFLYEQYTGLSKGGSSLQWMLNNVAVNKVKDTSSAVVRQMKRLLEDSKPQDIPLSLSAWIMTPIYVFLAQVKSPDETKAAEAAVSLEILLRPISPMSERFTGVRHSSGIIAGLAEAFNRVVESWDQADQEDLELELLVLGRRILREGLVLGAIVQT